VLLGAHVSSAGGIYQAVGRATEMGCRSLQVFPQSPRVWKPAVHADEDLACFRAEAAEAALVAMCHAPYLINLAGTDPLTVERSEAVLAQALRTTRGLGALAVIVHLGSHLGSGFEAGLERATPVLERVLELAGDGTWLLLEDTAGAGGTMGLTVEELAIVIERCGSHPWLGVCLDSCHLYASGIDVGDAAAVDAMLDELDERIGLDRLKALHVNDSQVELGSNRDRHASLGDGLIGERLSAFLGRPRLQGLPAVLETGRDGTGPDAQDMQEFERLWRQGVGG
jgi:deoxyribonuclease-4